MLQFNYQTICLLATFDTQSLMSAVSASVCLLCLGLRLFDFDYVPNPHRRATKFATSCAAVDIDCDATSPVCVKSVSGSWAQIKWTGQKRKLEIVGEVAHFLPVYVYFYYFFFRLVFLFLLLIIFLL